MERGVHALSHGQKQRVALAGALVHAPRLLLLDEPTAGLDPVGKQELLGLLLEQEAALVVASHDLDWVERCCTRFVLLEDGVITEDSASLEGIRQRWGL
jgi:energy-coupling factor transporter ATP-binding protein EcfA2